jgi:hypothetical protein
VRLLAAGGISYNSRPVKELSENDLVEASPQERRAFAASELVNCPGCLRPNAPNRSACLYCGHALEQNEPAKQVAVETAVAIPATEEIVHVVVLGSEFKGAAFAELARISNLPPSDLSRALELEGATPICATDPDTAKTIGDRLRTLGLQAVTVADQQLKLDISPREVRTIEFDEHGVSMICRYGAGNISLNWTDLILLVAGRLHVTTVEVQQKRGKNKKLGEQQFSTDEAVLDVYVRDDEPGCRIRSGSFDFSCLGEAKALTAFENFRALVDLFQARASTAAFDNSYSGLRPFLEKIWPMEELTQVVDRLRAGAHGVEATSTISGNERQFTRYSRLRRSLQAVSES